MVYLLQGTFITLLNNIVRECGMKCTIL